MKSLKVKVTLTVIVVSVLFISGCSFNSSTSSDDNTGSNNNKQQETYTLSLGHVGTQSHSWHTTALEFAKQVEKESEGRLKIEVFPDGQLGGNLEMLQQIQMGDLDMGLISGAAHSPIVPEMAIENLPFAFAEHEDAYKAMDGELGDRLLDLLEEKGIHGLAWWEDGLFQITNNQYPIEKPEDLNGLKIRVPEIELRQDTFAALGADPVPMSFTELFSALQQEVVDGQTNAVPIVSSSNFDEVQEFLSIVNITWSSTLMEINLDKWNSLPEDLQNILSENAIKYRDIQRERIVTGEEKIIKELEESGMKVNFVENLTPFIKASQPVYDKYTDVFGKELMDLILNN